MAEHSEEVEDDLEDGSPSEVYDKEAVTALDGVPVADAAARAQVWALLSIAAAVRELGDVVSVLVEADE